MSAPPGDGLGRVLVRELYDYHRWANRRLFDVAAALGAEAATRDMGKHWSVPTVKGMLAHLYGADEIWLARWKGSAPTRLAGDADFPTLEALRARWDALEAAQRAFVEGLAEADLARPVAYRTTEGAPFTVALGALLQHVANHATHHRSEIAAMLTLISGSPPDTGINTYRTQVVKGEGATVGMKELVDELRARRQRALAMGGPAAIAKQHAEGKLTARERIELLFDRDSFTEIGLLATHANVSPAMRGRETPADGVVTGFGAIEGRPAALIAYDFTVMAGSMGRTAEVKCNRAREIALTKRMPMIWLIDSAGARIQEAIGSTFAQSGLLFREQSIMSGVVPMVAAMMGPGAAGTAYIPALADFVPMVKGVSHMSLGGPPLVKAVVGEEVTAEELGGSRVHTEVSGVADLEVPDDRACLQAIREYLAFFPSSNLEAAPVVPCDDPADRMDEALLTLVPDSPRRAYDMKRVIAHLVDHGRVFEIKPTFARNVITCLARLGGRPVGIVASQPMVLGGALDVDAADKAARFIMLCDAFHVPLVFLQDVPGFMVGSRVERQGIIRHGAKMLYAVSEATVPKLTVVVRKAYGAGYFVMCGKAYEPDLIVAWPTAEISVMGPEGGTNIVFRKEIAGAPEPDAERARRVEEFRALINPYIAAGGAFVDDVIDPRQTRPLLIRALEMARTKKVERPWKKHGVMPV